MSAQELENATIRSAAEDASGLDPRSLLARGLLGQDAVRNFLTAAVRSGRVGQSYLFVGAPGAGKLEAAYAFAQAIVCAQDVLGACGACDDCIRVAHHTHPDVRLYQPESATGYLVEQVRDLIEDLQMAPVRAEHKVYILDEADALGRSGSNALLKSLEEPPHNTTLILLAGSRESVLPTVLSRCQVVPFRQVPPRLGQEVLSRELTVPPAMVRRALGCCPSISSAREFLGSRERQEARRVALRALEVLLNADELDLMHAATDAVEASKAPYESLKSDHDAASEEAEKWMSAGARKALQTRQRRELSARQRSGIMELFGAQRSLLRDALALAAGTGEPVVNDDFAQTAHDLAGALGVSGCARALMTVDAACARVRANVSPQLAIEAMLFDLKEMLPCRS